jgi:hypothetical protein
LPASVRRDITPAVHRLPRAVLGSASPATGLAVNEIGRSAVAPAGCRVARPQVGRADVRDLPAIASAHPMPATSGSVSGYVEGGEFSEPGSGQINGWWHTCNIAPAVVQGCPV